MCSEVNIPLHIYEVLSRRQNIACAHALNCLLVKLCAIYIYIYTCNGVYIYICILRMSVCLPACLHVSTYKHFHGVYLYIYIHTYIFRMSACLPACLPACMYIPTNINMCIYGGCRKLLFHGFIPCARPCASLRLRVFLLMPSSSCTKHMGN